MSGLVLDLIGRSLQKEATGNFEPIIKTVKYFPFILSSAFGFWAVTNLYLGFLIYQEAGVHYTAGSLLSLNLASILLAKKMG